MEFDGTWDYDFRQGFQVGHEYFGKYATDIYTEEVEKESPLKIGRPKSVGKVISSLYIHGLLNNTVVVFTTDNGGLPAGMGNKNAGSNYPLRGGKMTLWEGGTRGAAVLWSPLIEKKSRVASQTMHIVDWLPTLYNVAGGNVSVFQGIDGINQWETLSKDGESLRNTVVYNIDDVKGTAAIAVDGWKLITGISFLKKDGWYEPDGREGSYDTELLLNSLAGKTIASLNLMPSMH
ncbi:arylsulfatase B-like [Hyposmocoma kahamanoa]|uniref:arylsulfatase B-like n=1 Tax=Hyposmocoma kahamanoa TaxID=1477025 RepID=UPI000E6D7A61|nr:arylsulfatase B-like [Hyposmocoma kahamanoa]